jgi:WD40 repeat protein/DNA-binding SARP family transcriptional activator
MKQSGDLRAVEGARNGRTICLVRFCVLGPLEVVGSAGPVALGSPKQRRLLAALISQVGEPVSVDALVDAVWEEGAPRSAAKTLQGYVVHLRRAIAGSGDGVAIVTVPGGYRLDAPADAVDAVRFSALVTRSRQAAAAGDWAAALVFVTEARSLWRGPAYAEFADSSFATAEAARLAELRLVAAETGFECELALGEDAALVPDLRKALTKQPTRERLWELLIRALYLSGQQSDALGAYLRARDVLAAELGVDPGPELRAVHAAVLAQDPALNRSWSPPPGLTARQPRSGVYAFDGRDLELAWLRGLWLAAHEGGGRSAVICGPSGIGKTRLLATFADEVQRSQAVVVRRTGLTAPNLATVAAVAGGDPALVVLDDPLTGVDLNALAGLPMLVVAGIDPDAVQGHVRASFAAAQWRELPPLPDDVGARIARRWLGEDDETGSILPILQAAQGNPSRLHTLLSETVQQRSRQQIAASIEGLQTARADLAASRADVAHGVRGLRRGRALVAATPGTLRTSGAKAGCPYLGLETYQPRDSELFHGRDTVVEHLVARIADTALIAVVGASGSGKSSLVKAGLLAALSAGCLPGSASWPLIVVTPVDPLPVMTSTPAVVIIDQFEQAWVAHDDDARARYLDAVVELVDCGCRVVLTVRADHVDRCSQYPRLRDLVADGTVLLGPLNAVELTEVVIGPAELAGCEVESALVDRILNDVRGLTAPLPLVSTALAETWEYAAAGTLTLDGYLHCGGVAGALARRAEAAYGALTAEEQAAARHVLLRLATGEPGMLVRRRCPYPEAAPDQSARRAVDALAAARLITVDSAAVEVAHEALFDNWPRLTNWLEEDEQGRRLRAHLAPTALDWNQNGRPDSDLYRGVRLDAAIALARDHHTDLTPTERNFLAASAARAEQELQAERARAARETQARRRLRVLLTAVAAATVLAIAATIIAVGQRNTASDNARLATARQLGAVALTNQPLDRSLLLAVSAVKIDNNVSTRSDLLAALQAAPAARSVWHGDGSPLYQLALTDHDQTAIGSGVGGVSMWNLTGSRTATTTGLFANDFTPLLAPRPGTNEVAIANRLGSADSAPSIELWDPRTQSRVGDNLQGPTSRITSMVWRPDGRWLAAGQQSGDVLVWDLEQRTQPPRHITRHRSSDVQSSAGPPLGFPVVVYAGASNIAVIEQSGDTQVRSPSSTRPLRVFSVGQDVTSVASDQRGTMLAVGHQHGTATLSSLVDGRPLRALTGHSGAVDALTFSTDGKLIASVGDDAADVTDVATGRLLGRLTGLTEPGTAAAFTHDGRTLYAASIDGTIIGWDLVNLNNLGAQLSAPLNEGDQIRSMAVSRTGEVAIGYADGTLQVWGSNGASPIYRARVSTHALIGAALSPDGHFLAISDSAGVVKIVDVRSELVIATMGELPAPAYAVAFSPDGRRLVLVDDDLRYPTAHFFEAPSWQRLGPPRPVGGGARQVVWSSDSRRIAVGGEAPPSVYAASTGSMQWQMQDPSTGKGQTSPTEGLTDWEIHPEHIPSAVAWSPDESTIATGGNTTTGIQLLRASDGTPVSRGWGSDSKTAMLAFSPDGSILASSGHDSTVVLRDVASGDQIGPPLDTAPQQESVTFTFDAQGHLIVATNDGGLWRWDISLPHLLHTACAIAGRNLTAQEWAALNTGRPYVATCT